MRKTNKKSFDWYGLKQHFSIRKYHFGAASVLLGMSLALGTGVNTVSAAEAVGPDGNVVTLAPTDPNAGTPVAAPLAEDAAAEEPVAATEALAAPEAVTGDTSAGTEVVPVSPELQEVVNEYDTTLGQAPNDTTNEVLRPGSILDTKLDELVAANPTTPGLAEYVDKVKKAYPEHVTNEEKAAFVTATDFAVTSELNQILENYDSKIQVLDPIQYGPTATTQEQYEALKADAAAEYQKQLADKNAKIEAYKADLERYYADVEAALAANEEGKPSELITKNSFIVGDESLATITNITINDSTTEYLSYIQYRKEDMTVAHPLASPDGMQGSAVLTNPVLANRGAKSDAEVASSTFDLAADVSNYPYASGFNFAVKDGASITVEYSLTGNSTIEIDGVPTPIDAIRVTYTVTNTAIAPTDPKPWSSYTIYRDPRYGAWLNQAGATNDRSTTIHTATYEVIVDGQVVEFPADAYTTGSSINIGEAMTSSGEPIYINGSAIKTTRSTVGDPATWERSTSNDIIRYTNTNYDKALNPNVTSDGRVIDSTGPIPFGAGFIDSDGIVKRWDDYTSQYAYKGRVIYEIPQGSTEMSLTHYGNGGGWLILFTDVPTYEIKPVMDFECEIQPYFVAFETTIKAAPQESAGTQGQPQTDKIVSGLTIVPEGATTTYAFEDGNTVKIVAGEGSYSIDETGAITFTPEANFVGTATPLKVVATATYTNSNGEKNSISATTTYTPTVYGLDSKPDTTEGVQGQVQESISGAERFTSLNTADNTTLGDPQVTIPATGAYSFDDGLLTKRVDGEGTYTIDPDTGVVTFTPLPTFTGTGTGVTVKVTAEATDSEGNKITVTATDTYTPSVTPVEPTADDKETIGKQGQEQTQDAKTMFTAGDPAVPIDQTSITLLDENNQPTTVVEAKDADGNIVGVYTLDTDTGVITFSPNSDFVGTPVPVTVQAKDTNGTPVETTYTPTVTSVTPVAFGDETTGLQGQSQTSDLKFKEGDPVAPVYNEDGTLVNPAQFIDPTTGQPTDVTTLPALKDGVQVGTYTLDPTTGQVVFQPNKDFTGTPDAITVQVTDKNGTPVTATYTPTVTPVVPTAEPATTEGKQGQTQTTDAKDLFTAGDNGAPIDNSTITLIGEDGQPVTEVPAKNDAGEVVGKYVLNADGTITFTPNPDFIGTPVPVTVQAKDANGTPVETTYTPTVTPVTPTATPSETTDVQGQPQTSSLTFTAGDEVAPVYNGDGTLVNPAQFIDPTTGQSTDVTTLPALKDGAQVGTYTLDPTTGQVIFQPNPDFVGTPDAVTVQVTDKNGTPATATYIPTVTPVTPTAEPATSTDVQGKPQSGTPTFTPGDAKVPMDDTVPATFEDGTTEKVIPGEGTYTVAPDGTVTFTPEPQFTGQGTGVTVVRKDINGTPATATYTPNVTPVVPTAVEATSTGKQGQPQSGTLTFTEGDPVAPIDNSTLTLLDENGQPAKEVPAKDENGKEVGTYVLNEDGSITFTPNPDYVGTPVPVTVQVKDANGTPVETTYSPTVTPVVPTAVAVASVGLQGKPQTGTPVFTEGDAVAPIDNTTVTLLDENGQPAKEVPAKDETGKEIGTYVLNEDGSITFTPNPDFVGTPVPAKVQAKDANGTPVETTYSPKVIPVTPESDNVTTINVQGAVQTNTPTFTPGSIDLNADGVLSEDEIVPVTISADNPAKFVVDGQVVEETTIDAKDEAGNVVGTYTVDPTTGEITFTPNPDFVGTPVPATLQAKDVNGTPTTATYTPTVIPVTPVGSPAETEDIQGATQTGKPSFTGGSTVVNNETVTVPIDETVPATFEDGSTEKVIPGEGTYTVAPDGTVTFVPEKDFVGTAQGVTVKRVDTNGTPATATYTPTVTPVTPVGSPAETEDIQGATQSGKPSFMQGHDNVPMDDTVPATFDDGTTEKVIPGEGTYTVAPDGTVTFVPEKDFVGTGTGVTVVRQDVNGTKVTAKYTPTVTPVTPTGSPVETTDKPGVTQSGKPVFTQGHNDVPMDDTVPATFEDGTTEKVIPGEGTYTVAPDGTVTFVPEKDFIGTGTGVTVVRQDVNGTKATATYTPTVTPVETKWVDENGNPLKDPTLGATPNEAGEVPGYIIVSSTTDENGNVTHVFKQLETSYVDEDGNPLKSTDKGTLDPAEIKGYYVSSTTIDTEGNVTHVYSRISTTFVDEDGNTLSPKEDGPQSSKDIPTYILVGTEIDNNGNVKHIYKKSEVPIKEIITEWVDENGNPLKDPSTGETPEEAGSFAGYELVSTTTDDNGNVTHVFKKVVTPVKEVTTEWV
ncbi:TPA: YSIRK-type signal peptide-containing protein, partial [Streptococcus suis]|nr:YSIRK-type signal peptide-containing protein [Streptococcus suis]